MIHHIHFSFLLQYYSFIWWPIRFRTLEEKSKHLQTSRFVKLRLSGCGCLLVTEILLRGTAILNKRRRAAVLVTVAIEELVARHSSIQFRIFIHTLSAFCWNKIVQFSVKTHPRSLLLFWIFEVKSKVLNVKTWIKNQIVLKISANSVLYVLLITLQNRIRMNKTKFFWAFQKKNLNIQNHEVVHIELK